MIINIILLFFVLCYSNNAESVSLDLKTKIGNHLRRVLTQRSENYELVSHNYQFLFGGTQWLKGLSHKDKTLLFFPKAEIESFHNELGIKLIDLRDRVGNPINVGTDKLYRKGKIPLSVPTDSSATFVFENDVKPNFVNGHCLTWREKDGKTKKGILEKLKPDDDCKSGIG